MNAIWLSGAKPTEEQLRQIADNGDHLIAVKDGMRVASLPCNTQDELATLKEAIASSLRQGRSRVIYGDIPVALWGMTPQSSASVDGFDRVHVYAAWRNETGDHIEWVPAGQLNFEGHGIGDAIFPELAK